MHEKREPVIRITKTAYRDEIDRLNIKQESEAFDTGQKQSTISRWMNPNEVEFNITVEGAMLSNAGDAVLSAAADFRGAHYIKVDGPFNGSTKDEMKAALKILAEMQTCEKPEDLFKHFDKLERISARAKQELVNE